MKTTRKKMLLSSIAMLLVALVALGSATYAWFTINKTVEANTINVTAATTQGLVIDNHVTEPSTWARTVSFTGNNELNPVSVNAGALASAFPSTGLYAQDVNDDGEYDDSGATPSASGFTSTSVKPAVSANAGELTMGHNNYAASYQVKIKSSNGAAISRGVTATISATGAGTDFAKACLVDSNGDIVASYGDGYKAITAASPVTVAQSNWVSDSSEQVLASVAASTSYTYTLYVWYEGNDEHCDDNGQGDQTNFTVQFTLDDA